MATGSNTAANVSTGKPAISGGIYRAPLGTTLPNDSTTALGEAFTSLGYIAQGGVTHNIEMDSGEVRAWGGDLVMTPLNSKTNRFAFGMIEVLNPETYKTVYGESAVSGTLATGISVQADGSDPSEYVYVIELLMRGGATKRIVIPDGKVSEIGEIVYADDDAVSYPVTITAMAVGGKTHYEYIKKSSSS